MLQTHQASNKKIDYFCLCEHTNGGSSSVCAQKFYIDGFRRTLTLFTCASLHSMWYSRLYGRAMFSTWAKNHSSSIFSAETNWNFVEIDCVESRIVCRIVRSRKWFESRTKDSAVVLIDGSRNHDGHGCISSLSPSMHFGGAPPNQTTIECADGSPKIWPAIVQLEEPILIRIACVSVYVAASSRSDYSLPLGNISADFCCCYSAARLYFSSCVQFFFLCSFN